MKFAEMTAPDLRDVSREGTLILAPIAACEQHSRHLPVFTDTILATAVAEGIERLLPDRIVLLPTLWFGASDHHLPFGGTLTATLPTYEAMLMELVSPLLSDGFRRIMLLNGHGGNIDPLHVALRRLDRTYPGAILTGAAYWEIASSEIAALCEGPRKTMGHACEIETSMILHLRPDLVRRNLIQDDPDLVPADLHGLFWAQDFVRRTDHGAVGHPERADAERGKKMLDAIVKKVAAVANSVIGLPLPTTES